MVASREHFQGSLLGAAIGDALGKCREGLTRSEAESRYEGRITEFRKPHKKSYCSQLEAHQHTDDTDLLLLVGESIIERQGLDPADIGDRLIQWYDAPASRKRYRGHSTSDAIGRLTKEGVANWWMCGSDGDGCGAATRVIPVALAYVNSSRCVDFWCTISSIITHRNVQAVDGARVVAAALHSLCYGELPDLAQLKDITLTDAFHEKIEEAAYLLSDHVTPDEAIGFIGSELCARNVIPLSLLIFLSNPDSFECVIDAANANDEKGGDTDSVACLVGAMFGLYKGVGYLPPEAVRTVENSERARAIGEKLFEFANS